MGLRTVLVSGTYESMVDDLRNTFPGVSFRTADEINDNVFNRKEPPFIPLSERLNDKA